ncbi:MAG: SMP-30/gluconolactonase/LRE family protein [Pleomorphochaeta sp.]
MIIKKTSYKQFELAENPLWLKKNNSFYWVDIEKGDLYKYDLNINKASCILSTNYRIGAFVFDKKDNIILLTNKGLIKVINNDENYKLDNHFLIKYELHNARFNDAICDNIGRIIAGIKTDNNSVEGKLIIFEKNKSPRVLLKNIRISNGMGFSKDNKSFYHTDSLERTIFKYEYDLSNATLSNKKIFYQNNGIGVVDGMTVDNKDNIFSSIWGEGKIIEINKDTSTITNTIKLDCTNSSSLSFGGNNLDKLLVTSALENLSNQEITKNDGIVYLIENFYTKGKEEYKAKI